MEIKMLILILPSFFIFSFFFFFHSYIIYIDFFSVNFSAATWVRILKFSTKLDIDELYCVTKEQPHIAYQSFYLFIFLSLQWKFLSQISQLLLEPVFSNLVYTFSFLSTHWALDKCRLSSAFIAELLVSLIQQAWIFQSDRIPSNSEAAVKEL